MPTTPTPTVLANWQFSAQWRPLTGMAHGTRQPAMLGHWDGNAGQWDSATLDRVVANWISETPPADGTDTDPGLRLLRRLLFWTGALQRQHNLPVFGSAAIWDDPDPQHPGRLQIALPYASVNAALIALRWVEQLVRQTLRGEPLADSLGKAPARDLAPYRVQGFNTMHFLRAADALQLPWRPLVPGVFAFGQGVYTRWLESSYTERTSVLGVRMARDKVRTAQLLRQLGFPAPIHARARSAQHAVALARQIGYPVVVKPADRDQGQGVSAGLRDDASVLAAHAFAAACSDCILVEKHAPGRDYRLTVLHGRLIKTIERRAAGVTGDGRHTIGELVEQLKHDPEYLRLCERRGHAPVELDAQALSLLDEHGLTAQSVLPAGAFTALRRRANVSAGGTPMLVEGPVHPDNRRLAERAALALGLDMAGVDLILPDIAQSWLQTGALICEVNGQPQLGISTTPDIYRKVLRELLPGPSRIPIVLVVDGDDALARRLHRHVAGLTPPWGLACADGIWQAREQIAPAQPQAQRAAWMLAMNRSIGAAVLCMTPTQLVADGLMFDRIHLLVVAGLHVPSGWQAVDLAAMWRMVLPHVDTAVVCSRRHAPDMPAPGVPPAPRWQFVDGDDDALEQAAISHLLPDTHRVPREEADK